MQQSSSQRSLASEGMGTQGMGAAGLSEQGSDRNFESAGSGCCDDVAKPARLLHRQQQI